MTRADGPGADKESERQQSPESLTASLLEALGAVDRGERARAIAGAAEMVDPDLLVEAVADHVDSRRRNAAMDALAKGGARSVPALIRGLRHPDGEVVMFSAGVLARTGSPAAIPHLVSLLDHEDINISQQVIDSLAQMRSAVAVDALVKVLDKDPWLRFAAVHALGEIGDQRAVPALAPLLADDGVRGAVIRAMGKIGSTEALSFLFRVVRENQDTATFAQCLSAIGEALEFQPSEEALQNIADWTELASSSPGLQDRLERVLAADVAGAADDPDVSPDARKSAALIVKALKLRPLYTALVLAGRDPTLRGVLEFSAVSIGEEIVPVLTEGLRSPNPSVRMLACECIGALGHLAAAPLIEALVTDPSGEVRTVAINALVRLGSDAAVPAIARCLADPESVVRDAAATALCRMEVDWVADTLLDLIRAGSVPPRTALTIARANPHPGFVPFVVNALGDPAPAVRRSAVEALARQPTVDVVGTLEPLLRDPDPDVRRSAVTVLGGLRSRRVRQLLRNQAETDPDTLLEVVRALGKLGDTTNIPFLGALFEREGMAVKLATIEALRDMNDPATEPFLAKQLGNGDPNIRRAVVAALGASRSSNALTQLAAVARDPDPTVRSAVAEIMGGHESPQAQDALTRLAHDQSRTVAALARQGLEKITTSE
ncbi:MAG TPA: HEAT repeat domain-containing protein [Polyangia bacterium]|nr:HEAT repeat domain-containing protein [Polyangia bacterium]